MASRQIHFNLSRTFSRYNISYLLVGQILQITEQLKFPTLWKRFPTFLVGNLFQRVGNLFVVPLYCSYVRERVGNLFVVPLKCSYIRETFLFVESTRGGERPTYPPHATRIHLSPEHALSFLSSAMADNNPPPPFLSPAAPSAPSAAGNVC